MMRHLETKKLQDVSFDYLQYKQVDANQNNPRTRKANYVSDAVSTPCTVLQLYLSTNKTIYMT